MFRDTLVRIVIFFGCSPELDFGDLYVFDPGYNTWTQIAADGIHPSHRRFPGFAAVDGGIYLFAGSGIDSVTDEGNFKLFNTVC